MAARRRAEKPSGPPLLAPSQPSRNCPSGRAVLGDMVGTEASAFVLARTQAPRAAPPDGARLGVKGFTKGAQTEMYMLQSHSLSTTKVRIIPLLQMKNSLRETRQLVHIHKGNYVTAQGLSKSKACSASAHPCYGASSQTSSPAPDSAARGRRHQVLMRLGCRPGPDTVCGPHQHTNI